MLSLARKFAASVSGVSAIEFAIILPVMVTLFFGMVELSNYIEVSRRASTLASTAADLVAQEPAVSTAEVNDIFSATAIVGAPMDPAVTRIVITSVVTDIDGVTNRVAWSDARNTAARTVNSVLPASVFPAGLLEPLQGAVMVEVEFPYSPMFPIYNFDTGTITSRFYLKPRRSATVTREQ